MDPLPPMTHLIGRTSSVTISERDRIELVHALEHAVGPSAATTLMEYLPATGWRDVVTTTDLTIAIAPLEAAIERLEERIDTAVERLDGKIDTAVERLDGKIDTAVERLDGKIDAFGERLDDKIDTAVECLSAGMARQFAVLRAENAEADARLMRTLVITFVSSLVAFGGLVLAAASLGGT
jgi:hypothetical protein